MIDPGTATIIAAVIGLAGNVISKVVENKKAERKPDSAEMSTFLLQAEININLTSEQIGHAVRSETSRVLVAKIKSCSHVLRKHVSTEGAA